MGSLEAELTGGPREFAMTKQALEELGVTVRGRMPPEKRSGIPEEVVWILVGYGSEKVLDAAEDYLRAKWPEVRRRIRRDRKE